MLIIGEDYMRILYTIFSIILQISNYSNNNKNYFLYLKSLVRGLGEKANAYCSPLTSWLATLSFSPIIHLKAYSREGVP